MILGQILGQEPPNTPRCSMNLPKRRESFAVLLRFPARSSSKIANFVATSLTIHNLTVTTLQADTSNLTKLLLR